MNKIIWESQHYEFHPTTGQLATFEDAKLAREMLDNDEQEVSIQAYMHTPFGLWSVDDSMNPFKQFQFWMGHTNFSIGRNAESILKRIPGVEVLTIMTRYRFLIGVGQQFDIRDVRTIITKALCGENEHSQEN